jgi:VWFA-related protein
MSKLYISFPFEKFLAITAAGLLAFSGIPQAPQSQPSRTPPPQAQGAAPPPAVRVATRMVQVNVIVHDKDGNPVTGLTKDDFTLLDQGQRQQIASFSVQTNRLTATNAAMPANLFSNRSAPGAGGQPPLTVIVIDAYNTYWHDMYFRPPVHCRQCPPPLLGTVFSQVEEFISHMQPQDRVALYELADQLYLLKDFTSDPGELLRVLDRGRELAERQSFPPSQTDNANEMAIHTMDAMHVIADRLATVPGRKNLIWLSSGYPSQRIITDIKMDKTAKTLGNSDLPLYAVDAHGLDAPMGGGGGSVPRGGGGRAGSGVDGPTPASGNYGVGGTGGGRPGGFNQIRNLSEASGGRAFYNTNDLAGAIRRVIDDSATTYILGYYPAHDKWNGEFREIKVKVNRSGVEVRSRKGYFAIADSSSAPEREATQLSEAVRSPLESTDLGLDVNVDPVDVPGARQLKAKITIDAGQLRFQQQGKRWTDNIVEVWAEFDATGRQVAAHSQTINLAPTQDDYKRLLEKGLIFSETLSLSDDVTEVRLVVRDAGNGAIGSVNIPLTRLFAPATTQPAPRN